MTVNREYKSTIFTKLCEDKQRLLEIYNASEQRERPVSRK
jgi:hypothetical protein